MEKGHEIRQGKHGAQDDRLETIGAERIGVLPCASVEIYELFHRLKLEATIMTRLQAITNSKNSQFPLTFSLNWTKNNKEKKNGHCKIQNGKL